MLYGLERHRKSRSAMASLPSPFAGDVIRPCSLPSRYNHSVYFPYERVSAAGVFHKYLEALPIVRDDFLKLAMKSQFHSKL
jgi:hypothetical protein